MPTERITGVAWGAFASATGGSRWLSPSPMALAVVLPGVLGDLLFDGAVDIDPTRILHGEQHMCISRPLPLDVDLTVMRREPVEVAFGAHRGIATDVAITDERGADVARMEILLCEVGSRPRGPRYDPRTSTSSESPVWCSSTTIAVAGDLCARYADASGDRNPIHLDRAAAATAGFPDVVVHGMCLLSMAVAFAVDDCCDGDPARVVAVDCRFAKAAHPGDVLEIQRTAPDSSGRVRLAMRTLEGRAVLRSASITLR